MIIILNLKSQRKNMNNVFIKLIEENCLPLLSLNKAVGT